MTKHEPLASLSPTPEQRHVQYWRESLLGMPEAMPLPTDRPRTLSHDGVRGWFAVALDGTWLGQLPMLHAALSQVVSAALAVTLSASGAGQDIVLGIDQEGGGRLIRFPPIASATFAQLAAHAVQWDRAAVTTGGDLRLGALTEALLTDTYPDDRSLAQVLLQIGDARFTDQYFELIFRFETRQDGCLEGGIDYDANLFDPASIEAIAQRLQCVLDRCATEHQRPTWQLDLLTASERERVMIDWNTNDLALPDMTLAESFEQVAALTPDAAAVVMGDARLDYATLNDRANQLASLLASRGLGAEHRIAVALPRSLDAVIALLATLKMGAAYLPLDPEYPAHRLKHMMDDARPACLLTHASLFDALAPSIPALCLDDQASLQELAAHATERFAPAPSSRVERDARLTFIIYTSGSTGRPKGVGLEQRSLHAYLQWAVRFYRIAPGSLCPVATSLSFDGFILSILLPLWSGATVEFSRDAGAVDLLLDNVQDARRAGFLNSTPSHLSYLLSRIPRDRIGFLAEVLATGGEALSASAAAILKDSVPATRLVNDYGPTEATVSSTVYDVFAEPDTPWGHVPIGRPIANTRIYILDEYLRLAPPGVPGELYIAGAGLARGYLDRTGLTAERFVACPFGPDGERMYRTGDIARWNHRGVVEIAGRSDQQVKVRGFRVEPGEVAAALVAQQGVEDAVVVARGDRDGFKRLVGYVVAGEHAWAPEADEDVVASWDTLNERLYVEPVDYREQDEFWGWDSSYSGEPLPTEEMREWQAQTCQRILELKPRRLLEIGVGDGLILQHVASACQEYWGTDLSTDVITYCTHRLKSRSDLDGKVNLRVQEANQAGDLPLGYFDTIVMNSVSMYFPNEAYLEQVIAVACRLLAPGGRFFIGDVRNLSSHRLFCSSIEITRASDDAPADDMLGRIERNRYFEEELLVDPRFFHGIGEKFPQIRTTDIQLKRGRASNELTRHRYDVVLHLDGSELTSFAQARTITWTSRMDSIDALVEQLDLVDESLMRVTGLPYRRLSGEIAALQALEQRGTLAMAKAALDDATDDPLAALVVTADALPGYRHWLVPTDNMDAGRYDLLVARIVDQRHIQPCDGFQVQTPTSRMANRLHSRRLAGKFGESLRHALARQLPDYMVPSAIVMLDRLPLTPNGKLDQRLLPPPEFTSHGGRTPRSAQEHIIAGIFCTVLGLPFVSIDDSFFDLGGHSLLATRLVSQIRASFGAELAIRDVFQSPTVATLAQRLDHAQQARPALRAMPRPDALPLSYAQNRLWFLHRLEGSSATYNVPFAVRLRGELDTHALELALADLVERHESLRTLFQEASTVTSQRVLPVEQAGLRLHLETCHPQELNDTIRRIGSHAFQLDRDIPIIGSLLRLDADEHVLVVVIHHIAADGWSLLPLWRDLERAYIARSKGIEPDWQPLPVQYADYTLWQHQLLGDENDPDSLLARQLGYWRDQLDGLPQVIDLPTDRPRPAVASYRGEQLPLYIDANLHARLQALAQAHGATLFMVLQAALAVLLGKLGAGDDIAIGSPIAGRTDSALDDLVGFFVNTLVLRTDLSGQPSFSTLIGRVRDTALAAYANQDVPFERLVEAINPARSQAHQPLFQVAMVLQNNAEWHLVLPGLVADISLPDVGIAKFDLTFGLSERSIDGIPAGLIGELEYAADLFDRQTAQVLATRWIRLLEACVTSPDMPLSRLDLLDGDEHRQIQHEWNDTAHPLPDIHLAGLFEAQASRAPQAIALVCGNESLSYGELNRRADRLADCLLAAGAGPERGIAMFQQRSFELVISVLAIIKAGSYYVPLHPQYPDQRIDWVLKQTGASILLADEGIASRHLQHPLHIIRVDHEQPVVASQPRPATHEQQLAYVMFTSGSTGIPKGVGVSQRSIVALALDRTLQAGRDRVLLHSPHAFDASTYEIWLPLLTGGSIALMPPSEADITLLADTLVNQDVTAAFITSALFNALALTAPASLARLRAVWTGGDAADTQAFRRVVETCPALTLSNIYGPTESTTFATVHVLQPGDTSLRELPIGKALDNTTLHVLDSTLRPVPVGVPGELYIGGEGLARGYVGQPGLTAERFIAHPSGEPGARLYRTGDLVKRRADGELDYVGRTDQQVKIRGLRIEPGEVTAVLREHPGVAQAAVIVREDRPGERQLVGYVVAGKPTPPQFGETLRDWAGERLPAYLQPAAIVLLDALPRTRNGKLDHAALPAPLRLSGQGRKPRTEQEKRLVDLFCELLALPEASIDDNFFELGGHSLLATRLASRIRSSLGLELPIRDIFDAPTPARLAERMGIAGQSRVALCAGNRPASLPLSYAQNRLWFLHRLEGPSTTYNIPCAMRLLGHIDEQALKAALLDVVTRHESLRTVFGEDDAHTAFQQIGRPDQLRFEHRWLDTEHLPKAIGDASTHAFRIDEELPIRTWLFSDGKHSHHLLIVLHHIAADGWSLLPLWRDLERAYIARSKGIEPDWQPLPVQYADYTLWQHQLLGDENDPDSLLARQLGYWRDQLDGLPQVIDLPTDRPRPAVASYRGEQLPLYIDANLHARLQALAQAHGATLFMVLQAALAVLLGKLGAGDDIAIGSPIAGRTDSALDDLVGFFVNTLVLRTDLSGQPSFSTLIGRVRDTALAAYANQDVPFERLVEAINPTRSQSYQPLFQVMLMLQNQAQWPLNLPGVDATGHLPPLDIAKFDLSFSLTENLVDGTPAGMTGELEYASDLFDRTTVENFAAQWLRVLDAMVDMPDRPVTHIDLLDAEQRQRMLVAWNDTSKPLPESGLMPLFRAQARHRPHAVAVACGEQSLSYRELDRRSDQLARHLIARGIGPEHGVALLQRRGIDLVVSILAIIKSGGYYIPLHAQLPDQRLEQILDICGARLLLADESLASRQLEHSLDVLRVDEHVADTGTETLPSLPVDHPQRLAYVMFTSGSTGTPKGVAVGQREIVALALDQRFRQAHECVLMHSPHAFDASTYELWVPLLQGGKIAVLPDGESAEGPALQASIARHEVTAAWLTAGLFHQLAADMPSAFAGLQQVWAGGDVLSPSAVRSIATSHPSLRIVNGYGPTETTTFATAYAVQDVADQATTLPIGKPIDGMRCYVLDQALRVVPVGVTGELYIAGVGVSRGYLADPAMTAERFVADPFVPGERMYRSGDLVRWTRQGCLDYLGRSDGQVKLRGFRIELGEIELALTREGFEQCAVIMREDRPGDRRLVAYVVASSVDASELRAKLARTLPEPMLPAAFVALAHLPLTPNGKLDRRNLPAPSYSTGGQRPGNEREARLCTLFADVLGIPEPGIEENFFELGGHSLLATRLASRIRTEFSVELSLRAVFDAPTVASLAARLLQAPKARPSLRAMTRREVTPE